MIWRSTKYGFPPLRQMIDPKAEERIWASNIVIVTMNDGSVVVGYFKRIGENLFFIEMPMIHNEWDDYEHCADEITHWMYLPESAKLSNGDR